MRNLLFVLLIIAMVLEGMLTSLPLVLLVLILMTVYMRGSTIFFIAFLAGIILDILSVRQVGISSIFFLSVLLLILLYERKYEITSLLFVLIACFMAAFFYFLVFPAPNRFIQILLSPVIAAFLYSSFQLIEKKIFHPAKKI